MLFVVGWGGGGGGGEGGGGGGRKKRGEGKKRIEKKEDGEGEVKEWGGEVERRVGVEIEGVRKREKEWWLDMVL